MARTTRRLAALAALGALSLGFALPPVASSTAVDASAKGLERASQNQASDDGDEDDAVIVDPKGIAWK